MDTDRLAIVVRDFLAEATSAHARQIERQPLVAVTAYAPFTCAAEIRGVQIHGAA